jgi:hypothetical protein
MWTSKSKDNNCWGDKRATRHDDDQMYISKILKGPRLDEDLSERRSDKIPISTYGRKFRPTTGLRHVSFRVPGRCGTPSSSGRRVRGLQPCAVRGGKYIVYKVSSAIYWSGKGGGPAVALIRRQARTSNRQILTRRTFDGCQ